MTIPFLSGLNTFWKVGLLALLAGVGCVVAYAAATGKPDGASLQLSGVDYFHRWSKDDQHEFTPRGQENLDHWTDMVTLNYYPNAKDGDALAQTANAVLGNYKAHRAVIINTGSIPRTADKPAEHFVAAVLPTPDLLEAVYARFEMVNGIGLCIVYSHREYGQKIGDQMSAWLSKNGAATEEALKKLDQIPTSDSLKK